MLPYQVLGCCVAAQELKPFVRNKWRGLGIEGSEFREGFGDAIEQFHHSNLAGTPSQNSGCGTALPQASTSHVNLQLHGQ